jgi:hypothetical protein
MSDQAEFNAAQVPEPWTWLVCRLCETATGGILPASRSTSET